MITLNNLVSALKLSSAKYWGNTKKYLTWEIFFIFVIAFLSSKYFAFKILAVAQHGVGVREEDQDLLPWESLALLIEQQFRLFLISICYIFYLGNHLPTFFFLIYLVINQWL